MIDATTGFLLIIMLGDITEIEAMYTIRSCNTILSNDSVLIIIINFHHLPPINKISNYVSTLGLFEKIFFCFFSIRFVAEKFRMIWRQRPFWRLHNAEYYGEIFNANNGHLIIVDEILHNMRQSIANFDPHQMHSEASDYNLSNVDTIRLL